MLRLIPKEQKEESGRPEYPALVFQPPAFEKMITDLQSECSVERGGFLLGKATPGHIEISAFMPAAYTAATKSSLRFTAQTWNDYDDRKEEQFPDLELLGWAHTHPGHGVFLSNRDKTVNLFFKYLAVVYDPLQNEIGFFYLKPSPEPLIPVAITGRPKTKFDFKNYHTPKEIDGRNIP